MNQEKILKINKRSFITVCVILISFMVIVYAMTFFISKGIYNEETMTYTPIAGTGYSFWKFLTSPIRLLGSKDGINVIVISLFIIILGGSFNVMDQTHGINALINYLIAKFHNKKYLLMYIITLFFMLFGSLFGIFEESVTLLPIIIILALSLGWDTFTGLGMCLLAAGFGFSTALTNPFSVGLASEAMGIKVLNGIWFRLLIFILMYFILCLFLTIHVKKIEKNPKSSPTYESDQKKLEHLNNSFGIYNPKIPRTYVSFFIWVLIVIIASSILPFLQGLSIPIIAISFLIGIFICGLAIGYKFKEILKMFGSGLLSMSPAIIMLLLAGSIKFILDDAQIIGTIINQLATLFKGASPIMGILFIYATILVIQFFIGSASAKVILVIPIISILAKEMQISQELALLAFVFGDGYTDLIYPTNPVLLIALGMASFSYVKWLKKTYLLQILILVITVGILILGYYIGY